ncbi:hypothetical protein TcG_12701 [Trypanosoma cruzi]|nr:hypothetical protein TcG_12701 [Trypanosoma cruzi]
MPFFVDANDNSTKQSEAPVGHHIWATDTTHSLFLLPMAWPSCTSRNTPFSQLCLPLTQALKVRFGNPKLSTPMKNRGHARRGHTAPQRSLKPSSRLFNATERNTGGSRVTEGGQWERFSQRRKCQGVKRRREGPQGTLPATPDARSLIRATENQRHGCCGAFPRVHLTLGPMNAPRNILPRACSWPCRQSRVSSTFQQLLFWRDVALFRPCLPCAILV